MNRYNPVHDDAMVADENGTHVRYADHVRALSGFVAGTPKGAAMESVDAIAQKLIPCTCGGYGENKRRHMSDCPRHSVAWEDIAAALTAERENTKAAKQTAIDTYKLVRGLEEALKDVRAKFAAFADENGEQKSHCINCGTWWDRKERCPLCMGTHAEMVATKQAAEAAKEKIQ